MNSFFNKDNITMTNYCIPWSTEREESERICDSQD